MNTNRSQNHPRFFSRYSHLLVFIFLIFFGIIFIGPSLLDQKIIFNDYTYRVFENIFYFEGLLENQYYGQFIYIFLDPILSIQFFFHYFLGEPLGINFYTLFSFAFSGWSLYLLNYYLFQNRIAAFISGWGYSFFALFFLHQSAIFLLPFFILFLLKYFSTNKIGYFIGSLVVYLILIINSWIFGIILLFWLIYYCVERMILRQKKIEQSTVYGLFIFVIFTLSILLFQLFFL